MWSKKKKKKKKKKTKENLYGAEHPKEYKPTLSPHHVIDFTVMLTIHWLLFTDLATLKMDGKGFSGLFKI